MKRAFDIAASAIGLLILTPMFAIIAIWIKLDSKGPVFYKQIRVGQGNKDFEIFKFRSMIVGADKGSLISIGNEEQRVTRSGKVIRKYKLDEIPQLINVLIGDMSFVGPRPEVRYYVNYWTEEQMEVLSIRPGITDPASIRFRDESEILGKADDPEKFYIENIMQEKLAMNLEYVRHNTIWNDIKIIFKTFSAIIK